MLPKRRETQQLRLVETDADAVIDFGSGRCLVPDGDYRAVYVRHELAHVRRFGDAAKCFVWFRIVDPGEHFGKQLYGSYRVAKIISKTRFILRRDSELLLMLARVLGVQKRPDRISLRDLKDKVLVVRIGTVSRDSKQRERPEFLKYSVIRHVIRCDTGQQ